MNDVIIRKVQPSDFDGLVSLYDRVWPDVNYNKKDKANFVLNESDGVCYCAEKAGTIVGSRTSFHVKMFFGNRPLNCLQLADSCIDSSCRGQGLFLKMNKAFLNDFFPTGDLIYNISVIASKNAYEKLGWKYIESLMVLRKFVNPIKTILKLKFNIKKLSTPIVWESGGADLSIPPELLFVREKMISDACNLHIKYDEQNISWRLKSQNGIKVFRNKELGCIIYKLGHRGNVVEALIGETFLYTYNNNNFKSLMKSFSHFVNADILSVWISEGHPLKKWYRDLHFLNNPSKKYLYHGVKVESNEMKKICYNPDNWAISSLDIDTF